MFRLLQTVVPCWLTFRPLVCLLCGPRLAWQRCPKSDAGQTATWPFPCSALATWLIDMPVPIRLGWDALWEHGLDLLDVGWNGGGVKHGLTKTCWCRRVKATPFLMAVGWDGRGEVHKGRLGQFARLGRHWLLKWFTHQTHCKQGDGCFRFGFSGCSDCVRD